MLDSMVDALGRALSLPTAIAGFNLASRKPQGRAMTTQEVTDVDAR